MSVTEIERWLALVTREPSPADRGDDLAEPSYPGYARQRARFVNQGGDHFTNAEEIVFPEILMPKPRRRFLGIFRRQQPAAPAPICVWGVAVVTAQHGGTIDVAIPSTAAGGVVISCLQSPPLIPVNSFWLAP